MDTKFFYLYTFLKRKLINNNLFKSKLPRLGLRIQLEQISIRTNKITNMIKSIKLLKIFTLTLKVHFSILF